MRILSCVFFCFTATVAAQQYEDYQLRLEPVWARVADALGEYGSVESAEFSPDGKHIVSGTKYDNRRHPLAYLGQALSFGGPTPPKEIERVAFSGDNAYVAAASEDYLVTVFDAATGRKIKELKHKNGIDGLIWSNTGLTLVSGEEEIDDADGSKHGYIRVFSLPAGEETHTLDFEETVQELFFSTDDKYLIATGHGSVKVYETAGYTQIANFTPEPYGHFVSGGFSPDAKSIIAADKTGKVYLWDWQEDPGAERVKTFNHLGRKIETIAWHPRGGYVAFTGHSPYIFVYRISDIRQYANDRIRIAHKVWAGDHAEYIDFNRDGSFLVSAHQNGLIKLWAWMGEEPDLNQRLHSGVKAKQDAAMEGGRR